MTGKEVYLLTFLTNTTITYQNTIGQMSLGFCARNVGNTFSGMWACGVIKSMDQKPMGFYGLPIEGQVGGARKRI